MFATWIGLLLMLEVPPAEVIGAASVYPNREAQQSVTGAGVRIGVWDLGFPRLTHEDFTGKSIDTVGTGSTDSHSTAVVGILIGHSVGIAYEADVTSHPFSDSPANDLAAMRAEAEEGLRLSVHPYHYSAGWQFKSGGWGSKTATNGNDCQTSTSWLWDGTETLSTTEDVQFGYYSSLSADWDELTWDEPYYLPVVAAGNQQGGGPETQPVIHCYYDFSQHKWVETDSVTRDLNSGMTQMAVSKNVMTIGTWPSDPTSGRGMTDDGRIKPDIVAPGSVEWAPASSADNTYGTFTKTSAASSVATGGLALIHQHYAAVKGADPLASTLKAIVIHTAEDKGDAGPDAVYGWGLMDVEKAVRYVSLIDIEVDTLSASETHEFSIQHHGYGELVATLVWTDPAGMVPQNAVLNSPDAKLIHDLDVRITGTGGPYLPIAIGGGTADNTKDNVEQIQVSGLAAGHYTVTVSHKGSLTSDQPYSLVIRSGDPQRRLFTLSQPGWRLISIPFQNTSFSRLGESFVTQFGDNGDPTIYQFTSGQEYAAITDEDSATEPGDGYLMYVFAEDAPKNWVMRGEAVSGPVATELPWNGSAQTSFLLAGNPYHRTLDWDAVVAASTGMSNSYYVWDPSVTSGGGTSGFRHYTAGNPGSGDAGRYIPPFTGFFVFAMEEGADLVLDSESTVTDSEPVFYGRERPDLPHILISGPDGDVMVFMHPDGRDGWDRYDVPELSTLDGSQPLALLDEDGTRFRVMTLPENPEPRRILLTAPAEIIHSDFDVELVGQELHILPSNVPRPTSFVLLEAYPNPFNSSTEIRYQTSEIGPIHLSVFDLIGREVATLVDESKPVGAYVISWDAGPLASGVYMVRMRTATEQRVIKLTLLK